MLILFKLGLPNPTLSVKQTVDDMSQKLAQSRLFFLVFVLNNRPAGQVKQKCQQRDNEMTALWVVLTL